MCQCKDFQLFIILQKKKSKDEDFFQEYCVRKMDDKRVKKKKCRKHKGAVIHPNWQAQKGTCHTPSFCKFILVSHWY